MLQSSKSIGSLPVWGKIAASMFPTVVKYVLMFFAIQVYVCFVIAEYTIMCI